MADISDISNDSLLESGQRVRQGQLDLDRTYGQLLDAQAKVLKLRRRGNAGGYKPAAPLTPTQLLPPPEDQRAQMLRKMGQNPVLHHQLPEGMPIQPPPDAPVAGPPPDVALPARTAILQGITRRQMPAPGSSPEGFAADNTSNLMERVDPAEAYAAQEAKRIALAEARGAILKKKNDLHDANFAARNEGILNQARATAGRNTQQRQLLPPDQALAGTVGGIDEASVRRRALSDYNRGLSGNAGVRLRIPDAKPEVVDPAEQERADALERKQIRMSAGLFSVPSDEKTLAARKAQHDMAEDYRLSGHAGDAQEARKKRNAEIADAKGVLTPGARKLAIDKGYLKDQNADSGSGTHVNRLLKTPGFQMMPEDQKAAMMNHAMAQDGETEREGMKHRPSPEKTAMAEYYRAAALQAMIDHLGIDHPLVRQKMAEMQNQMGGVAPPPTPPPKRTSDPRDPMGIKKIIKPAPQATGSNGTVYGNPYGPSF